MRILFPYMARWHAINWSRYHSLLTSLATAGHQVYVIQPPKMRSMETNFIEIKRDSDASISLLEAPVNPLVWNIPLPLNKLFKKGYYSLRISRLVREIIKTEKIDVLILYNIPQYPLLKQNGCVTVFDCADDYIAMLRHELGYLDNPFLVRFGKSLLEGMCQKADITLSVSHVLAKTLPGNVHVLPNGVDLRKAIIGSGAEIRSLYPKPIVGFIGSFEYFIDFELILSAAYRLPEITFLLVGSGREWPKVKRQIEVKGLKNVILVGGVPHTEVFRYIDAMDICLNIFKKLPISDGACPIKLFEYMAMKKPVITTRLQEVQRIDPGCFYYADSTEELAKTINLILHNETTSRIHAERGYQLVIKEYTWNVIADHFSNLVKNIMKKL